MTLIDFADHGVVRLTRILIPPVMVSARLRLRQWRWCTFDRNFRVNVLARAMPNHSKSNAGTFAIIYSHLCWLAGKNISDRDAYP